MIDEKVLLYLIDEHEPILPGEYEDSYSNADDAGNFKNAFAFGVSMGQRILADEIRAFINEESNYERPNFNP